ncbi:hypothetical protein UFOVP71_58 [uncultured Caudovirales phage]|uniref:ATPase, AAA-type, core n=1 Tax=uncultured Caudovirales phage TaxID=2100421 RepID=A0A6J5TD29_9CAUD|nr:hypothetical protein UFOVP71_58 [uncultured Caudovirales phage]
MSAYITIKNGTYRSFNISNQTFQLVADYKEGTKGGYVTVIADETLGEFAGREVRVKVAGMRDVEPASAADCATNSIEANYDTPVKKEGKTLETDEQAIERIRERFDILEEMSEGAVDGTVRAMIVVGPPGVGKSFGVEKVLNKAAMFDKIGGKRPRYEVVKGAMSAIGLYAKLYQFSDEGNVLVFDDCDSVLMDELSLNILKAALDSSKKRTISWNTDSRLLRSEGIPDKFEFKGSAIFITNIKFENVRSAKLKDHLGALESRCHYLDLTLDTTRDKMLRIKQIMMDGMLDSYDFEEGAKEELYDYVDTNKDKLRELSLRTVIKIADLKKMTGTGERWKRLAETTVMKREF